MKVLCMVSGLMAVVLLFGGGCRRKQEATPGGEATVAAGAPTEETVPAALADVPAETAQPSVFDRAQHDNAMNKLAPVHHARIAAAQEAREALQAYEQAQRTATSERAAIVASMEAIDKQRTEKRDALAVVFSSDPQWQQLSEEAAQASDAVEQVRAPLKVRLTENPDAVAQDASLAPEMVRLQEAVDLAQKRQQALAAREEELTDTLPAAKAVALEILELTAKMDGLVVTLQEQFAQDDGWKTLHEKAEEAEKERKAVREELTTRIQNRMRTEFAEKRAAREAEKTEADGTAPEQGAAEDKSPVAEAAENPPDPPDPSDKSDTSDVLTPPDPVDSINTN